MRIGFNSLFLGMCILYIAFDRDRDTVIEKNVFLKNAKDNSDK